MSKNPIPMPKPDVVRPPTPSEVPEPDEGLNIPEPSPGVERSPLPSTMPPGLPQEAPKQVPPGG